MRRILIGRARRRNAQRRGAGTVHVNVDAIDLAGPTGDDQMIAVDEALARFAVVDAQKAELVSLLHGHELEDGALDAMPDGAAPAIGRALQAQAPVINETPDRIGRYHLQRKLGEGGFGVVWVAEQREPLRRQVALKIVRPGMDSREVLARFEMERQALALMDHPNIARV